MSKHRYKQYTNVLRPKVHQRKFLQPTNFSFAAYYFHFSYYEWKHSIKLLFRIMSSNILDIAMHRIAWHEDISLIILWSTEWTKYQLCSEIGCLNPTEMMKKCMQYERFKRKNSTKQRWHRWCFVKNIVCNRIAKKCQLFMHSASFFLKRKIYIDKDQ